MIDEEKFVLGKSFYVVYDFGVGEVINLFELYLSETEDENECLKRYKENIKLIPKNEV